MHRAIESHRFWKRDYTFLRSDDLAVLSVLNREENESYVEPVFVIIIFTSALVLGKSQDFYFSGPLSSETYALRRIMDS